MERDPSSGRSPWSRSICRRLPAPTAGSRTRLCAPLQDSQQHQSLSAEHKGQKSSGSAAAPAALSKPTLTPPSSKGVGTVRSGSCARLQFQPCSLSRKLPPSLWELVIMREACEWIHLPHKTKLLPLNLGTGTGASR